ncbi:hypothetical protein [Xenorhabdus cabanillasii]|uniref:Uncharacterized protein n=1 Tax=Xenorhabdus cabanillasii JM26 TaxID=1427517 RepID=W1IP19_9GAMM|nr:hypothetical protein [Xenorhabdus cabanillasii]PHM76068.1 hypothetical protein Xcab_03450 [Xenorhabdus cabanillasii JM26]CDL80184.1 hypothetical protein XCR1_1410009 [Xenorhabdus cabanillasii JM26]
MFVSIALGQYGVSYDRILEMSRPELDGWIAALGRLQGAPAARNQRKKRVKSLRQKKQLIKQRG